MAGVAAGFLATGSDASGDAEAAGEEWVAGADDSAATWGAAGASATWGPAGAVASGRAADAGASGTEAAEAEGCGAEVFGAAAEPSIT